MKKKARNILIIILVLLAGMLLVFFKQFNNIKALIYSYQLSDEDIESKIEDNDKILEDYVVKYDKYIAIAENELSSQGDKKSDSEIINSDLLNTNGDKKESNVSEKKEEQITPVDRSKKELTTDEGKDKSKDENKDEPKVTVDKNKNESKENTNQKTEDEIISEYVVRMYSLKNEFSYSLSELEKNVYEEYIKLPVENRDFEHKKQIVMKYFDYVTNLEKQCDKEVENIVTELKKKLEEIKADIAIVSDIKKVYENEKILKKAYYINLLKTN